MLFPLVVSSVPSVLGDGFMLVLALPATGILLLLRKCCRFQELISSSLKIVLRYFPTICGDRGAVCVCVGGEATARQRRQARRSGVCVCVGGAVPVHTAGYIHTETYKRECTQTNLNRGRCIYYTHWYSVDSVFTLGIHNETEEASSGVHQQECF